MEGLSISRCRKTSFGCEKQEGAALLGGREEEELRRAQEYPGDFVNIPSSAASANSGDIPLLSWCSSPVSQVSLGKPPRSQGSCLGVSQERWGWGRARTPEEWCDRRNGNGRASPRSRFGK